MQAGSLGGRTPAYQIPLSSTAFRPALCEAAVLLPVRASREPVRNHPGGKRDLGRPRPLAPRRGPSAGHLGSTAPHSSPPSVCSARARFRSSKRHEVISASIAINVRASASDPQSNSRSCQMPSRSSLNAGNRI